MRFVALHSVGASPNGSLPQIFAHERPFVNFFPYIVPGFVIAGKRPSRLTNRDILGLSEDIQRLMEECWDQDPGARPHASDALALFETASRGWVSPTSEAIANLALGHPTSQNPSMTELADPMLGTGFGTTGGSAVGREEGQLPPMPDRGQGTAAIRGTPLTPASALPILLSCIINIFPRFR